jgi:hypothetical protein
MSRITSLSSTVTNTIIRRLRRFEESLRDDGTYDDYQGVSIIKLCRLLGYGRTKPPPPDDYRLVASALRKLLGKGVIIDVDSPEGSAPEVNTKHKYRLPIKVESIADRVKKRRRIE